MPPTTFALELDRQCERIIWFVAIVAFFVWFPYVSTDKVLHPEAPAIQLLRIGLSIVSALMMLVLLSWQGEKKSLFALLVIGLYLQIATGILTGLTGADPVYVGGFLFVLMLVPLGPIPRHLGWLMIVSGLGAFAICSYFAGASFASPRAEYSLKDLVAAGIVSAGFVFFADRLRRRSWENLVAVRQREKELESAREKAEKARSDSDRLLESILPVAVADELKATGIVKPLFYESVTVVFTDFVDFTRKSRNMLPDELIDELDGFFSYFDQVAQRSGLEKLKTIGDAYMCAGGLPLVSATHAIDACLAALEFKAFITRARQLRQPLGMDLWDMRIGIHTGPVTAGVIGSSKFAYDIWGDTVNTASRIEEASEPGRINISATTFELVHGFFDCYYRGYLPVKGKGDEPMYFLDRIRPILSEDSEGLSPNQMFRQLRAVLPLRKKKSEKRGN